MMHHKGPIYVCVMFMCGSVRVDTSMSVCMYMLCRFEHFEKQSKQRCEMRDARCEMRDAR